MPNRDDYARRSMRSFVPPPWAQPLRRRERVQRAILLIAIIAIHWLLLLWLVTRPPTVRPVRDPGTGLVLISVSSGQRIATPTVPKPPPPIVLPTPPIILPSPLPTPSGEISPSAIEGGSPQAGEAGGCALASRTAEAIAKDPAAMAELASLPPAFRTSADAVMLWNGVWLASDPRSTAFPLTPSLRRAVERVVAEASPECQATIMTGPQFLAIPEQNRTTTLVIGSGTWRWSDLLTPSASCVPSPTDACLVPSFIP